MLSSFVSTLLGPRKIEPVGFEWEPVGKLVYPCQLKREHFKCSSSVEGIFEYEPGVGATLPVGKHTLTVTFLPADEELESQVARREVIVEKAIPQVTWKAPGYINEGTPLGKKQQNAVCINLPSGEYNYDPPSRAKLVVGEYTLKCEYIPEPEYRKNYASALLEVPLKVIPMVQPTMQWPLLRNIEYEEVIGKDNIMTATCNGFEGRITYDPPEGTLLQAGKDQLVKAMFTPYNRNEFKLASIEQLLTVSKARPRMEWLRPAPIYTGTPLSLEKHLNARNELVPNETAIYEYDPPEGSVLEPGEVELRLTFTPDQHLLKNYLVSTYSVPLTVLEKKKPHVRWAQGQDVLYLEFGQELSKRNVFNANCTSYFEFGVEKKSDDFGGYFTFDPSPGTLLQSSYSKALERKREARVALLKENRGADADVEMEAARVSSGDKAESLNGSGPPPSESWDDNGGEGEEEEEDVDEEAGEYTITLTFTPHNTVEWDSVVMKKRLLVRRAKLDIVWENRMDLLKNMTLNDEQLNATVTHNARTCTRVRTDHKVEDLGLLTYSEAAGTLFHAGDYPVIASFCPHRRFLKNYQPVHREEIIHVVKPAAAIMWDDPPTMYKGYKLGWRHLNATCPEVPGGEFSYDPHEGTELPLGRHTLRVTYNVPPADEADYRAGFKEVAVVVMEAKMPDLTWEQPEDIPYNTPLDQFILNAKCDVQDGFYLYDPPRGTVLEAGESHTLKVLFQPDDHLQWLQCSTEVKVFVYKAEPVLQWEAPREFYSGMHLESPRHLCCCPQEMHLTDGDMSYSPGPGAVLSEGTVQITATFTPPRQWRGRYSKATKTITLTVLPKRVPPIVWKPYENRALDWDTIIFGTKLSRRQLNAHVEDGQEGEMTYDPPLHTLLQASKEQILTATFTPANREVYAIASVRRSLQVEKATPALMWEPKPLPFMYVGKEITTKTCNAVTTDRNPMTGELLTGRYIFCPPPGEVLPLGRHTLTVIFQPDEHLTPNYTFASKFIIFPVIEIGSLFRLPKRYTDPEPRPEYKDDREYTNGPLYYGPYQAKFFFSEVDTVMPSEHDRRIMEKREEEMKRRELVDLERLALKSSQSNR